MKNVLVLGGTGFVGRSVCEQLVRQGWRVSVPSRRRVNARSLLHLPTLSVLEMDVHDPQALASAVAGHDAVVNLVAVLHGTQAVFDKVHRALPESLASACKSHGVKSVVHVSALGADAQHPDAPPSMYLRSKSQGEAAWLRAAAQADFDLSLLRPSVIFGADDKLLNVFAKLQAVFPVMPLTCAHARFQPVWVQDVAGAVVRSLERPGAGVRILELCGPDIYSLKQLVQLSAQLSGVRQGRGRPVLALPEWAGRLQARLMALAPGEPMMSPDNLDSMRSDNIASSALPGLASLGIVPAALVPIARDYLQRH
jgi:NADH dehydrogenase